MNNAKQVEVKSSILYKSANDADKATLVAIAMVGDCIAKDVKDGTITIDGMKRYIELHTQLLKNIKQCEIRELLCKASYAEAVTEASQIQGSFGESLYNKFITDLREIGGF